MAFRAHALTVSRAHRNARVQVAICTMHATMYANWYGIKVETRNRSMLVVIIRRLGVLAVKAGNAFLLKSLLVNGELRKFQRFAPSIVVAKPRWPGGEESIDGSHNMNHSQSGIVNDDTDAYADHTQ